MAIIEKEGNFYLDGVKTPAGNDVFSPNRNLIKTIQAMQSGYYDATKFGIFSIYCTYRDFITNGKFFESQALLKMTIADPFFGENPGGEDNLDFPIVGVRDLLEKLFDSLNIPKSYFRTPEPESLYNNHLKPLFLKIPQERMTAFVLINARLRAPMSLLLLFLHDMYSIENFKSNPYQFDSEENAHYFRTVETVKSWLEVFQTEIEKTGESK
ncbi:hypothetical protein [Leptospira paudalimensis]|uniref:Uncharacterized protein n=1 Tax=Leptospira paudalimensis TaxID=2950024 RepID=A0ABT3MCL9_9LEPT|nr:hypothetical protein [Leptospira paudalimensis]MCW7506130.1 hypothetical protein [Leptospira paudalimensis]